MEAAHLTGALAAAIDAAFGSFEDFKAAFGAAAGGQFGSGWAWFVKCIRQPRDCCNIKCGFSVDRGSNPNLTCDVWEHAYYLDYQNGRGNYVSAWWSRTGSLLQQTLLKIPHPYPYNQERLLAALVVSMAIFCI